MIDAEPTILTAFIKNRRRELTRPVASVTRGPGVGKRERVTRPASLPKYLFELDVPFGEDEDGVYGYTFMQAANTASEARGAYTGYGDRFRDRLPVGTVVRKIETLR